MIFISPELRIFKRWAVSAAFIIPLYSSAAVVKMEVSKKHIGNVLSYEAIFFQTFIQRVISEKRIMPKEFLILFVS